MMYRIYMYILDSQSGHASSNKCHLKVLLESNKDPICYNTIVIKSNSIFYHSLRLMRYNKDSATEGKPGRLVRGIHHYPHHPGMDTKPHEKVLS